MTFKKGCSNIVKVHHTWLCAQVISIQFVTSFTVQHSEYSERSDPGKVNIFLK